VIVLCIGASGCAGVRPVDGIVAAVDGGAADAAQATGESGSGTLVYRRNSLALLDGSGDGGAVRLAAQVLGLSSVELLEEGPPGIFTPRALQPPTSDAAGPRAPLGLVVLDLTGDGLDDVFVADSQGSWLAEGQPDGGFLAGADPPWTASFTAVPDLAIGQAPNGAVLVGGWDEALELTFLGPANGAPGAPLQVSAPWGLNVQITPRVVAAGSAAVPASRFLLAGDAQLAAYDLGDGGVPTAPASIMTQSQIHAPYLVPFDAFDHLAPLSASGCDPSAVGVGVFANASAGVPRRLEQLAFHDGSYDVTEIDSAFDVVTFAVVAGSSGESLVGALGMQGSSAVFAVYHVAACNQWSPLATVPTDFDWRAPSQAVPQNDGAQILGLSVPGTARARFLHYDGYDVRSWDVEVSSVQPPTADVFFQKTSVHATRSDVAL